MASKPPIASSLNPNAPAFVPAAHQAAEDFSPEWWQLIQTNNSFREWWMKERFVADENEQAASTAAVKKEDPDFDDIDDLLELGFQSGILDDLEDQPSPVAVPQQQHHLAYQQRQPYYQPQQPQQPQQQQQQGSQLHGEHVNFLIPPSHSFQKFGSGDGAVGAQFYRGAVLKEGKPQ
jgi:hypothetical protein